MAAAAGGFQNFLPAGTLGGYHSLVNMRFFKTRWRFLLVPIYVVLLVAFFYGEEDWRAWHAWKQFTREWEAKAEKFGYQYYAPAPVPDDQNFAMTPVVVSCYGQMIDHTGHEIRPRNTNLVNRLEISCLREADTGDHPKIGSRQKQMLTDLKVWQQYYRNPTFKNSWKYKRDEFPVSEQPQSPAADVLLALSKYDLVIEDLRKASQLPYSRFPLEYDKENPAAILLPHLAAVKKCSVVLQLRAIAELQNDQSDRAFDDVKLMLRLMDSVRNEPLLISHLVRNAILQMALQTLWEGMAEHRWSDAQLAEVNQELGREDFLKDYKLAMHGEMAFQEGIARFLSHHPEQFLSLSGEQQDTQPAIISRISLKLIPNGWFVRSELHCAQPMEKFYLPAADVEQQTVDVALIHEGNAVVESDSKPPGPFNILEGMLLPALGAATTKFAYAQSSVNLARVACGLERCRMAHGQYPASLDGLAPQYIEKLPHDVIGGAPLIYRPGTNGVFQLYSIGWNEIDDGGVSVFRKDGTVDTGKGDWTWQ
jgi:hypothetical protein